MIDFEEKLRQKMLKAYSLVGINMALTDMLVDSDMLEYALLLEPTITLEWPEFNDKTGEILEVELHKVESTPTSPSVGCSTPMSGACVYTPGESDEGDEEYFVPHMYRLPCGHGGASLTTGADSSTPTLLETASEENIATSSTFTPLGQSLVNAKWDHIPSQFGDLNLGHADHEEYPCPSTSTPQSMPILDCIDPLLLSMPDVRGQDVASEDDMYTPDEDYEEEGNQSVFWRGY